MNPSKTTSLISLILASLGVIFVLIFVGCTKEIKPLIEFVDTIQAPQAISFLEVGTTKPTNVTNVKVTLIDPRGKIIAPNGIPFKSITLKEGVMCVGLSSKTGFDPKEPYRFSVRAEAEGYMTTVRSIVITDIVPNYIPIYLAKIDEEGSKQLPLGLAASTGTFTIDVGANTQIQTIYAQNLKEKEPQVKVNILPNTVFLNSVGKPIESRSDELNFKLLYGKPRNTEANLVFPGGFEVTEALDENMKPIASPSSPIFFTTVGWFSMEMNIDTHSVKSFSQPIEIEMMIPDSVFNPETKRTLKIGDKIPLWSMENSTGIWHLEPQTITIIGASPLEGQLMAKFKIKHLSTFNLDIRTGTTCTLPISFVPAEINGNRFTEYYDADNNTLIRGKIINFSANTPGTNPPSPNPLELLRVPANITGKLYIHTGTDQSSAIFAVSSDLNCSVGGSLSLLGNSPNSPCAIIEFLKQNGQPANCTNAVWHKKNIGAPHWTHVGNLNSNGQLNIPFYTNAIQQFHLFFAGINPGTSVELTFEIDFDASEGQSHPGTIVIDGQSYQYSYIISTDQARTCNPLVSITLTNALIQAASISC